MIIDSQVLHTGTDDFFDVSNEKIIISPRRFTDIADDDKEISANAFKKLSTLLKNNQVYVAPFCDACLIYRHLMNSNELGNTILKHKNLFWYTDGYLQSTIYDSCVQTYSLPSNFVAEFSGQINSPAEPNYTESRFICMMNNHRNHRDQTLLNLHHRNLLHKGNVVYHEKTFSVPNVMEQDLFEDTREKEEETYKGHITDTPIYNGCMIELVSEAFIDDLIFITEKAVRPMAVGIPSIYVAGYKYVQALRDLGFKTHDDVIDHSYDNEQDDWVRINKACMELKAVLDTHTPQQFFQATHKDTVHNQMLLKEKYLNKEPDAFLKRWINDVGY